MYPEIAIQEFLDVAASIVVVLDRKGIVQLINRMGCEILGYDREEVEGKHWFRHFVPKDEALAKFRRFRKFMLDGCPNEFRETFILTKQKNTKFISWSNASIRDKEGNIIAMLRSGQDITEKTVLQEKLATQEKEKRKQTIAAVLDAQEKERLHIASELHDNVGQILTTCKILLEGEISKQDAPETLNHTYMHLQRAINELRSISHQLNPAQLHEIGLISALKELVKTVNMASSIDVILEVEDPRCLDKIEDPVSLSLFRIVQEQLNNILKHANATEVTITITKSAKAVELEIVDNGKGFRLSSVNKGLGLKNMYNRAELFNGRVIINTAPGEGCTLSVYIPLV
jgi:PAS domain S-box-containing protein